MPAAKDHLIVRRIIDLDRFALPVDVLFPGASLENPDAAMLSLADRHVDFATGEVLLAIQSHVFRFAGKTILIDTCVGEHKPRPLRAEWNERTGTRYLANLAAAGWAPEQIDIVMCTHLHADHVGWNTRLQSGRWVPTFSRARYAMSQREIDQRAHDAAQSATANHGSYQDSVLPIIEAGLVQLAGPGDVLADGASIVDLAGHGPGQIGLEVSFGARPPVLFCGDAIHSPLQVLKPDWSSKFCFDPAQAARTRRKLLERAAGEGLKLIPGHLRAEAMRIAEKSGNFQPVVEG
ncbi:MAG: MBL fold metallo-hydrolase [Hyphomicrobiales bacterium]|nr:MBL fold metallo-hydrolase [Hyphomicrobiales bacterium]